MAYHTDVHRAVDTSTSAPIERSRLLRSPLNKYVTDALVGNEPLGVRSMSRQFVASVLAYREHDRDRSIDPSVAFAIKISEKESLRFARRIALPPFQTGLSFFFLAEQPTDKKDVSTSSRSRMTQKRYACERTRKDRSVRFSRTISKNTLI